MERKDINSLKKLSIAQLKELENMLWEFRQDVVTVLKFRELEK